MSESETPTTDSEVFDSTTRPSRGNKKKASASIDPKKLKPVIIGLAGVAGVLIAFKLLHHPHTNPPASTPAIPGPVSPAINPPKVAMKSFPGHPSPVMPPHAPKEISSTITPPHDIDSSDDDSDDDVVWKVKSSITEKRSDGSLDGIATIYNDMVNLEPQKITSVVSETDFKGWQVTQSTSSPYLVVNDIDKTPDGLVVSKGLHEIIPNTSALNDFYLHLDKFYIPDIKKRGGTCNSIDGVVTQYPATNSISLICDKGQATYTYTLVK